MRSGLSALLVMVTLSACRADNATSDGVVAFDSAGVSVVHHSAATIDGAPTVSLTEVFRVGTRDGPEETRFFRLATAQEANGEIYSLDVGDHRIRVFSANGAFLRAFGREGGGPGEFQRPSSLDVHADTVVVLGQRLNLLDPTGELLATGPGRVFRGDGALLVMTPTARGWKGIWQTRKSSTVSVGRPFRDVVTVHDVDPLTGNLGAAIFSCERAENRLAGEIGFYIAPFYQAQPGSAIGPNGNVYYTPGDRYRIDVVDGETGELVRRIDGNFTARAVTRAMVADAIALERARVRDAPPGSEMEMYAKVIDQRAALPVPETLPVFGSLHVSPTGRVLALRLDLDADPLRPRNPSTWDLFSGAGRLQGRMVFPAGTRVLRLTSDGLLTAEVDDLDVQYLVRYRFPDTSSGPE